MLKMPLHPTTRHSRDKYAVASATYYHNPLYKLVAKLALSNVQQKA